MKKPKSKIEDEDSYEDLMRKVKKKGSTSKCSYCSKGFHSENKFFKKNMDIMFQLLEKHKIKVPDELEKPANSSKQCHTVRFQGDITYALSGRVLSFSHVSNIDLFSDISEPFFDDPPLSLLDSSPNDCDFSLDPNLSLSNSSSLHSNDYNSDLEAYLQYDMHVMTHIIPPSIPSTIPLNNPKTTNPKITS